MTTYIRAEYVHRIARFVSTEAVRYYLNGFLLERHPDGGALLVATDGHRLAVIHDACAVVDDADLGIVKLSKSTLKACQPGRREQGGRWLRLDDGKAHVVLGPNYTIGAENSGPAPEDLAELAEIAPGDPAHLAIEGGVYIDGTYPDWRRVVPDAKDCGAAPLAANGAYIADFGACSTNGKSVLVNWSNDGASALVRLPTLPEFIGVLMGMRAAINAKTPLPDWWAAAHKGAASKAA